MTIKFESKKEIVFINLLKFINGNNNVILYSTDIKCIKDNNDNDVSHEDIFKRKCESFTIYLNNGKIEIKLI